jgi:hypothetical protein
LSKDAQAQSVTTFEAVLHRGCDRALRTIAPMNSIAPHNDAHSSIRRRRRGPHRERGDHSCAIRGIEVVFLEVEVIELWDPHDTNSPVTYEDAAAA